MSEEIKVNDSIDVQKIMHDIDAEIAEKHLTDNLPKFDEPTMETITIEPFDLIEYNEDVRAMNSGWDINPWFVLTGNSVKKFIKRIIRKLNMFLLAHICNRQTEFNSFSVRAQNQVQRFINEQQTNQITIDRQTKEVEVLKNQVKELTERIERLEHR